MVQIKIEEYLKKQLPIAACLYLGHIMVGFTIGWSSPMVIKLQRPSESPLSDILTDELASWIGSSFHIGILVGPHISGPLSNIIGRKLCLLLGASLNFIGQVILIFSFNFAMIFTARVLAGVGLGIISIVNIVYIGEIASSNIRGIILTGTGVFHVLGTLVAYSVGPYLSYAAVGFVATGISVGHFLAILCLPESPIYYLLKGKEEEAKKTLRALGRGKDVDKELKNITESVKELENKKSDWQELFTIKSNRMSLLITSAMFIFQQSSGTLAAAFFSQSIFEKANTSIESSLSTIIVGLTQLCGALIVPTLIEKSGRKSLSLASQTGCGVGMTVLGIYFYLSKNDNDSVANLGWLPLAALMLSFFSYSIGMNITPNTLTCEMYRPNVRSIGSSLSLSIGVLTGFISITTFGYLIASIGEEFTFWLFAVINVIAFVFTLLVVPETKGMSLAEIEKMLGQ